MKSNQSITINFHSFVDIITNSSTVIFTYVNSIDAVKEFINEVIANFPGVTVTADELYEFKEVVNPDSLEGPIEEVLEDEDHPQYEALTKIYDDPAYKDTWSGKWNAMKEYAQDNLDVSNLDHWSGYPLETQLRITPKQSTERRTDLGALLEKVFSHEAFRDG